MPLRKITRTFVFVIAAAAVSLYCARVVCVYAASRAARVPGPDGLERAVRLFPDNAEYAGLLQADLAHDTAGSVG